VSSSSSSFLKSRSTVTPSQSPFVLVKNNEEVEDNNVAERKDEDEKDVIQDADLDLNEEMDEEDVEEEEVVPIATSKAKRGKGLAIMSANVANRGGREIVSAKTPAIANKEPGNVVHSSGKPSTRRR
jgi:hypothetical protein